MPDVTGAQDTRFFNNSLALITPRLRDTPQPAIFYAQSNQHGSQGKDQVKALSVVFSLVLRTQMRVIAKVLGGLQVGLELVDFLSRTTVGPAQ